MNNIERDSLLLSGRVARSWGPGRVPARRPYSYLVGMGPGRAPKHKNR